MKEHGYLFLPPNHVTYFAKSGERRPVKNRWATKYVSLKDSCYVPIEKIFPNKKKTTDKNGGMV